MRRQKGEIIGRQERGNGEARGRERRKYQETSDNVCNRLNGPCNSLSRKLNERHSWKHLRPLKILLFNLVDKQSRTTLDLSTAILMILFDVLPSTLLLIKRSSITRLRTFSSSELSSGMSLWDVFKSLFLVKSIL